jgi:hypothetical protein
MTKYIPKVGEAFEWEASGNWNVSGKVVLVTPLEIVWLDGYGITQFITISKSIMRPIPTKANVEREQIIEIMRDISRCSGSFGTTAERMQKAGFTIPKKIKRSNVRSMVDMNSSMKGYEDEGLVTAICELLGDLVEQDGNGGKE